MKKNVARKNDLHKNINITKGKNTMKRAKKYEPGWAPSSITCNFDVICPALMVFVAKEMRTEGFSFPGTCSNVPKDNITLVIARELITHARQV